MRLDLETIKKIEFYLTDGMTLIEKKIFEQEIQNDIDLKEAVDQQQELMLAMERTQLKSNAVTAYKIYNRRRVFRWVAGILIPSVIIAGTVAGYSYMNSQSQINNPTRGVKVVTENLVNQVEKPVYSHHEEKTEIEEEINKKATHYNKRDINKGKEEQVVVQESDANKTVHISEEVKAIEQIQEIKTQDTSITKNSNLNDFFEKINKKKTQVFKRKADQDMYIVAEEGTMIGIPANSLVDANGERVKGEVDIEVTEYYKKSDIILGNLHSMSNNNLLESGGMLHIVAKQKNEELTLAPDQSMKVLFTARKKNDRMEVFNGSPGEAGINWIPQSQNSDSTKTLQKSTKTKNKIKGDSLIVSNVSYKWGDGWGDMVSRKDMNRFNELMMPVNLLGWINCDRFKYVQDKTTLTIHVDGPMNTNADVRVIFKEINSVMGVYGNGAVRKASNIPVDYKVTVIAFAYKNKEFYYTSQDVVVTPNQDVYLTLQKSTEELIANEMEQFDSNQKNN